MLPTLLQFGLTNALTAAAVSPLVFLVGRMLRRPPVSRALWLLVLIKLVTPPLWTFPLSIGRPDPPLAATVSTVERAAVEVNANNTAVEPTATFSDASPVDHERPIIRMAPPALAPVAAPVEKMQPPAHLNTFTLARHWRALIAILWLAGSSLYLLLILRATVRLRRIVTRSMCVSPDVLRRAARLAARLGLRRLPHVRFVAAPVPPMLCAIGMSPRLLLPIELWEQLNAAEQDSVLAHELAHLRRGDHRVRLFELAVTCIFWWLPVLWWARRELREATEQCCDAWVLSEMPRSSHSYAAAILQAIEYMSTAPAAEPALASGMGQFTDLKRRLVMIQRGTVQRALSWPAFASICGAAAILLPLAPTLAQSVGSAPPSSPETDTAQNGPTVSVAPGGPAGGGSGPATTTPPPTLDGQTTGSVTDGQTIGNVAQARQQDQLLQARRTVERLRRELDRAEARLAIMEGRDAPAEKTRALPESNGTYEVKRGSTERRLDALEKQFGQLMDELRQLRQEMHQTTPSAGGQLQTK